MLLYISHHNSFFHMLPTQFTHSCTYSFVQNMTLFTLLTKYWICIPLYTFYKFINTLVVDDDKNGLCICCCTYHITTSIFSHISYTWTHHCSLSTHHYTPLYTQNTLHYYTFIHSSQFTLTSLFIAWTIHTYHCKYVHTSSLNL